MSDQAGLVRAICEHPGEDVHRLVYADWLDDHGRPDQAEFSRAQVELAGLPEHDARVIRAHRVNRDRNAAPDGRPPPPPPADGTRWGYEYRRGFPWMAKVFPLSQFLPVAPYLFEQAPI